MTGGNIASGKIALAMCARCNLYFPYQRLQSDPNSPGLRVCRDDLDQYDPYRLPARSADPLALRYPRPDVSIAVDPLGVISDDRLYFLMSDDGSFYVRPT